MSDAKAETSRILVIAGSDSCNKAGITIDIETIKRLKGQPLSVVTALTIQSEHGVEDIFQIPLEFIIQQIKAGLNETVKVVKIGMLGSQKIIEAVALLLERQSIVLDPVFRASSGEVLLPMMSVSAFQSVMIPLAKIITPNLPEAEQLTGRDVQTIDDMKHAADALMTQGANSVLIKGGHGYDKHVVIDLLATQKGFSVFEHERLHIEKDNLRGTGCRLSSALAVGLARGQEVQSATEQAIEWLQAELSAS